MNLVSVDTEICISVVLIEIEYSLINVCDNRELPSIAETLITISECTCA